MQLLPYRHALLLALALTSAGSSQTRIDLRTQGRNVDFSGASSTKPVKTGPVLPGACSSGELFFKDNVEPGRNLFGCTENQWVGLGAGALKSGCGLSGCESGECRIDSGVIPSYEAPLAAHGLVVGLNTSTLGAIAPGPSGHVLVSNGTNADPSWAPMAGGAGGLQPPAGWPNAVQYNAGAVMGGVPLNSSATRRFLMQINGEAPVFAGLEREDIPALFPNYETAPAANGLVVSSGAATLGTITPGPAGYALISNGPDAPPSWTAVSTGSGGGPPAGSTNAVQYNAGGFPGGVPLNAAATRKFLMQLNSGAPSFEALRADDVPTRVVAHYASIPAAKCLAGVAAANFNLPPANAPTAACQTGSTYGAVLQFAANSTQSFLEHFELPPDWSSAPNTIDLELAGRSADSTHTVTVAISYACAGETSIDDLAFQPAGSITFTPRASRARTRTVLTDVTVEGCAANDEYYLRAAITTDAAATASYELISIRPVVRRAY